MAHRLAQSRTGTVRTGGIRELSDIDMRSRLVTWCALDVFCKLSSGCSRAAGDIDHIA